MSWDNYVGIVDSYLYRKVLTNLNGLNQKRCLDLRNRLKKAIETAYRKSEDLEEQNKKFRKQGYKLAEDAFRYLYQRNYPNWTINDIIEINYIITQGQFGKGFRDKRVFIQGSNVSVPSPERVHSHMQFVEMILQVPINPLEKSILIHFAGVRIHPFLDGNGRTFRLLQNTLLYQECIYPFVIDEKERKVYFGLLENASREWLDTYDNLPRNISDEEILIRLYLTPRPYIKEFGNFVTENILEQFKK